jgi:predicted phosphodiesterase
VLRELRRIGVDEYVCAGDLVGYGAWPNECVEAVATLDPIIVAGNHDLIAAGRLVPHDCVSLARETLLWTEEVLQDDSRRYLERLPLRAIAGAVVVAHGSIDDPEKYTLRDAQARIQLEAVQRLHPEVRAFVLGHTHRQAAYAANGRPLPVSAATRLAGVAPILVNPGAVGQSREYRVLARFLVLDLDAGLAQFGATGFDVAACREGLRRAGLPLNTYHLPPAPLTSAARRARRIARGALAGSLGRRR